MYYQKPRVREDMDGEYITIFFAIKCNNGFPITITEICKR